MLKPVELSVRCHQAPTSFHLTQPGLAHSCKAPYPAPNSTFLAALNALKEPSSRSDSDQHVIEINEKKLPQRNVTKFSINSETPFCDRKKLAKLVLCVSGITYVVGSLFFAFGINATDHVRLRTTGGFGAMFLSIVCIAIALPILRNNPAR